SATTDPGSAASNAILGQALDAAVSNRVERLFGSSRVKIDPQFIGQQNNPSARVTVEQTINNNITVTYITNVTQTAETVVQLEYNVDKNVSIVAVRDENGVLGCDGAIPRPKETAMRPGTWQEPYLAERLPMVEEQLRGRGIRDQRVLAAMSKVPRHEFVARQYWPDAYADHPVPIGEQQTTSQP